MLNLKDIAIKNMMSATELSNQTTVFGFLSAFLTSLLGLDLIPEDFKKPALIVILFASSYQAYLTNRPSKELAITQKLVANVIQETKENPGEQVILISERKKNE